MRFSIAKRLIVVFSALVSVESLSAADVGIALQISDQKWQTLPDGKRVCFVALFGVTSSTSVDTVEVFIKKNNGAFKAVTLPERRLPFGIPLQVTAFSWATNLDSVKEGDVFSFKVKLNYKKDGQKLSVESDPVPFTIPKDTPGGLFSEQKSIQSNGTIGQLGGLGLVD